MASSSWIQLYNSEFFDFENPSVDNIGIKTIAHSLSNQCRFNGHCNKFYSVAEHSMLVADRVMEQTGDSLTTMFALLHDVSEAVICDIPRPIKRTPELAVYRKVEHDIQTGLVEKFVGSLPIDAQHRIILNADLELLSTEKEQVMSTAPHDWGWLPEPLDIVIPCYDPWKAKTLFLSVYNNLKDKI